MPTMKAQIRERWIPESYIRRDKDGMARADHRQFARLYSGWNLGRGYALEFMETMERQ